MNSLEQLLARCQAITEVSPQSHQAAAYVQKRGIPAAFHQDLYCCDNLLAALQTHPSFSALSVLADTYGSMPSLTLSSDGVPAQRYQEASPQARFQLDQSFLLLPCRDQKHELRQILARRIQEAAENVPESADTPVRYISIIAEPECSPLYFRGLELIDASRTVFITEGTIDSFFLPNALGSIGTSRFLHILTQLEGQLKERLDPELLCFVFDKASFNSPYLYRLKLHLLQRGCSIVHFPRQFADKDINQLAQSGYSEDALLALINQHRIAAGDLDWRKVKLRLELAASLLKDRFPKLGHYASRIRFYAREPGQIKAFIKRKIFS